MYHKRLESLITVVKVIQLTIDDPSRGIDENRASIRMRRAANRAENSEKIRGVVGNVSSTVGLIKVRVSGEVRAKSEGARRGRLIGSTPCSPCRLQ